MTKKNSFETKWYKLDNTAIIFPVISNKKISSVFRVSCTLKEEVLRTVLEEALEETLECFKNFAVKLKKGFFWHYFETNKNPILVDEEKDYPCNFIDLGSNNQFLFKVTYFNKRINLEVFHALTDGEGAMRFLKSLAFNYIKIANKNNLSNEALKIPSVEMFPDNEDSYIKNYKKVNKNAFANKKAYRIIDKKMPLSIISVIHGYMSTNELIKVCKSKNVTITQYLTAVMIWCIYKEHMNGQVSKNPINITVPVSLRKFFGSTTSNNFFSIISVGFNVNKDNYVFDDILEEVINEFKEQLTKESLSNRIFSNVSFEKNIFVRSIPLFIKNIVLKFVYFKESKTSTSVLSNLGKIEVPIEFERYIDSFQILIDATESEAVKCSICSYCDKLACTFTSRFETPYLERAFFRYLESEGLDVIIESNGVHNEEL